MDVLSDQSEPEGNRVVCDLRGAIIGHIGNDDTELCGSLEINVVYPNAIPDNDFTLGQLFEDGPGHLRILDDDPIGLPADTDEVVFFLDLLADQVHALP